MKLARKSGAFDRVYNRLYKFTYLNYLIQLFLRKGFRSKYVKIIGQFILRLKTVYGSRISVLRLITRVFNKYVPTITFVSRKVAANVYQLPWFIGRMRAKSLLIRWFYYSIKERLESNFVDRIYNEFMDMRKGYGKTVRKLEEHYKLAIKGRPFMRYLYKRRRLARARIKKYGRSK